MNTVVLNVDYDTHRKVMDWCYAQNWQYGVDFDWDFPHYKLDNREYRFKTESDANWFKLRWL